MSTEREELARDLLHVGPDFVLDPGFPRFVAILNAQEAWRGMTKIQRSAVSARLCDCTSPRTLAALERRGIVHDGLLTAWGDFVRHINQEFGGRDA